ncbi:MAG TPA: LysM peptidoglycan-binding domain-containing protein [Calditrichia bacterium]|nr:LysM peptidoglycan-binding domain-containing protein [Calditrichia bacterium]
MVAVFEFCAEVGEILLENQTAEKRVAERLGNQVRELSIKESTDGTLYLGGWVEDQATFEKLLLIVGNLEGISRVNTDALTVSRFGPSSEFYTVKGGDTLSAIAHRFYNSTIKFGMLLEANLEVIQDPDLIFPGQVIRIPSEYEIY